MYFLESFNVSSALVDPLMFGLEVNDDPREHVKEMPCERATSFARALPPSISTFAHLPSLVSLFNGQFLGDRTEWYDTQ